MHTSIDREIEKASFVLRTLHALKEACPDVVLSHSGWYEAPSALEKATRIQLGSKDGVHLMIQGVYFPVDIDGETVMIYASQKIDYSAALARYEREGGDLLAILKSCAE